jgi:hypothetical protein
MPEITLTLGSPTWTNATGGDVLITALEGTGPGQNGTGPVVVPGIGGTGVGSSNSTDGEGADPGDVAGDGAVYLNGSPASGEQDVVPGDQIELVGGGGSSSAAAGGASGSSFLLTVPEGFSGPVEFSAGAAGEDTTINRDGASTAVAQKGGDADGDTPGVHGTVFADMFWDDWNQGAADGEDGTGPTFFGGSGGNAGNWASVDCGAGYLVHNGGRDFVQ